MHRLVDIRRQHRDSQSAAIRQVHRGLVLVVTDRGEQTCHVLGRIVGLEIGGPERHQPVPGSVRLVERVAGERQHGVPQGSDRRLREAVLLHAVGESAVCLVEDFLLFLTHRATQQVGLAERVAGDLLRDVHDLFLVDDQTVSLRKDVAERLLELRVNGLDLLQPVLSLRVVGMRIHAHRTRPVQRQHRDDVLKAGRAHQFQQIAHRGPVELEHPERVTARQQLVGFRVVQTQVIEIEIDAAVGLDVLQRVTDDGEVAQTEEVHLQQADGLTRRVVPAGDDGAVLGAFPHRDGVDERLGTHDHRAGVHARVADQALQTAGGLVDGAHVRIGVDQSADLGGFLVPLMGGIGDAGHRDVLGHDRRRQCLGDAVGDGEARLPVVDPGRILQCCFGFDGTEGDHLGNAVAAPLLAGVAHHLTAATIVEVDVDIGHRHALGIQETLEQQTMRDGIDIGDAHGPCDQRTCRRTSTRADPDTDFAGVADEVTDDEKVRREAHLHDDVDLVISTVEVLLWRAGREAPVQASQHLFTQPGVLRLALRDREDRHPVMELPDIGVGLDTFGDQQRRVAGTGYLVIPHGAHVGGRLEVVAVTVELEPRGVRERLARLDAQQRLVVVRGLTGDVVAVIGRQRRNSELAPDLEQARPDPALDVDAVVHQLEEEVLLAEDLLPLRGGLDGFLLVTEPQPGLHLTRRAAGGGDDAGGMLGDDLRIHAGPLTELTLERSQRRQLEQIAQTGRVLGDHRHVGVGTTTRDVVALLARITPGDALGIEARRGRDVRLDTDDGLDALVGGGVVELAGAEHVSVVGHADSGHTQPDGFLHHRLDLRGTVQHRVFGVIVEVHELAHRAASLKRATDTSRRVGRCVARRTTTTPRRLPERGLLSR